MKSCRETSPDTAWSFLRMPAGGRMTAIHDQAIALGADLHSSWIDEIYDQIHARLREGVLAVGGITALLGCLRRSAVPFCVASNGSEAKMAITLGQTDLLQHFDDAVFSAHSIGIAKPDPGLFLHAAEAYEKDTRYCVVVEDSSTGAKVARTAGMRRYCYAPNDDGEALANDDALDPNHSC